MNSLVHLACSTCRANVEGSGEAASWSIFFLLIVILAMLGGIAFFMIRIALREKRYLDPSLSDDPVVDPVR
jgi:hypothetical protein